jgi:TonB family protein
MKKPTFSSLVVLAFLTLSLTAQEAPGGTVQVTSAVAPVYPPLALTAGVMGEVQVKAIIEREGSVAGVEVISGREPLKQASLEAARRWKFNPRTSQTEVVLTFSFKIVPHGTAPEDTTATFIPPHRIEVKRTLPDGTVNYGTDSQ